MGNGLPCCSAEFKKHKLNKCDWYINWDEFFAHNGMLPTYRTRTVLSYGFRVRGTRTSDCGGLRPPNFTSEIVKLRDWQPEHHLASEMCFSHAAESKAGHFWVQRPANPICQQGRLPLRLLCDWNVWLWTPFSVVEMDHNGTILGCFCFECDR